MSAPALAQCEHCSGLLTEAGQGWIHANGFYRCPGRDEFAAPLEQRTIDDAYADGYRDGEAAGRDEDCGCEDRADQAAADAREAAIRDVIRAVEAL
ncbi:hypothetical protein FDJ57_gp54 [Gordonia phage Sour]|uniref:Uncharacterized protein n=1 Tax=Gordonia phage Sour TaxID=2182349 RepID=A0A2U8UKM8_9CAUD|nr:hypothetical protein FDJ57_gp54 [Gordonia phage Sour]AWN04255.1 hypothetical protein PBI_SOUR_54 [Gordonia phage Sour]